MAKETKDPDGRRIEPGQVIALVLVVLVLVFILENSRHVRIRFLFPEASVPVWLALILAAGAGFLAGMLVTRRRGK